MSFGQMSIRRQSSVADIRRQSMSIRRQSQSCTTVGLAKYCVPWYFCYANSASSIWARMCTQPAYMSQYVPC